MIAKLFDIERPFAVSIADAGAHRRNHGADFRVLQHLIEAGLLHVDELAANRQNRLKLSIPSLFGRTTGGITLDDVNLGIGRVAIRASSQLSRQSSACERPFADRLTGFAGG